MKSIAFRHLALGLTALFTPFATAQTGAFGISGQASSGWTKTWGNDNKVIDRLTDFKPINGDRLTSASIATSARGASAKVSGELDGVAAHLTAFSPQNQHRMVDGYPEQEWYGAHAQISLWDTVNIKSGGSIPIGVAFDGDAMGKYNVTLNLSIRNVDDPTDWMVYHQAFNNETKPWTNDVVFHDMLLMKRPNQWTEYKISLDLNVTVGNSFNTISSANFGNTARFLWDLPEGAQFTSRSGAFRPNALTPEPCSLAVLGLGAFAMRRRRARAARN